MAYKKDGDQGEYFHSLITKFVCRKSREQGLIPLDIGDALVLCFSAGILLYLRNLVLVIYLILQNYDLE